MTDECCLLSSWCHPNLSHKNCPLSEDVSRSGLKPNVARKLEELVTRRTLAKCGKNMMPLVRGLCFTVDFDQMWSKICPLPEDFVSLWTLTNCGPKCAPCWRTLSCCGLWPNVVQNVPLVGGLCLTVDFDHMWSEHVPLVGGLCHAVDFNQMWFKHVPLNRGLCFATEFDHIWINNKSSSKKAGTKQTVLKHQLMQNWNCHLRLRCHMINPLEGIFSNKPQQKNDASHIHHTANDKWRGSHTTITDTVSYLMREESILIGFTWTSWRFLHACAGLFVDATMIALFACWRLEQNGNEGAMPTTTNHGQKAWLSLTTVGSSTANWILLKFGALQSLAWLATTIVP